MSKKLNICPKCNGNGTITFGHLPRECPLCLGKRVLNPEPEESKQIEDSRPSRRRGRPM
jgi:DnaJ-class molecular chaperone